MKSNTGELDANVDGTKQEQSALSATLYLRGGGAGTVERLQAAIRDRFEAIAERGVLASGRVKRWANSVVTPISEAEPDAAAAVAVYRELELAVDAAGGRLDPFFERQERRGSLLFGQPEGQRLTFPVACLVLRREGRITGVYPCRLDGVAHSVTDGLAALESGDPENLR